MQDQHFTPVIRAFKGSAEGAERRIQHSVGVAMDRIVGFGRIEDQGASVRVVMRQLLSERFVFFEQRCCMLFAAQLLRLHRGHTRRYEQCQGQQSVQPLF